MLTLFTPQHGKLRVVAKGVRRPGSKKAGHLEPFTLVNLLLARGRELDIITQAEAVRTFPQIRTDLLRLGLAAYVAELIDRFGVQEGDSLGLFQLAADTLDRLDREAVPEVALRYFQIWLLTWWGIGRSCSAALAAPTRPGPWISSSHCRRVGCCVRAADRSGTRPGR